MNSSPSSGRRSRGRWRKNRTLPERRRSGIAWAMAGSAIGFGAQLILLTSAGTINGSTALLVAITWAFVSAAVVVLPPRRILSEVAFLAAVAGLGGLGMLVGSGMGAGTAGMLIGCLMTCLWLCHIQELCARDRDWRHHVLGLAAMVGGMILGAMLLTTVLTAFIGGAAGHFAMVLGMAAGTGAGMWFVDRYDDLHPRVRRWGRRLASTASGPEVGPN